VSLNWVPSGNAIIATGPELDGASPVWRVSYPNGGAVPITTDFGHYSEVSLSGDGRSLATVRTRYLSALWVAPANDTARARRITSGERADGVGGLDWTPDGRIVYASEDGANRGLWIVAADGSGSHVVLPGSDRASAPRVSPDGGSVAFHLYRSGTPRIWAMGPDGKNLRPVTGGGADYTPSFAPDGKTLYFASAVRENAGVWKMPFDRGRPERIARSRAVSALVSPDGRRIAFRSERPDGGGEVLVIPAEGGPSTVRIPMAEAAPIAWSPDSAAVVWPRREGGNSNLWAHPLDGGIPRRITAFSTPDEIYGFAWSRDGKRLAVARGRRVRDAVLIRDTRRW
jgi:Tol biopolymer transport system component